jgi:hypothetical protein
MSVVNYFIVSALLLQILNINNYMLLLLLRCVHIV